MSYPIQDWSKPSWSGTGTQFAQDTRLNMQVIRDAVIMSGGFYGWDMVASGGTADKPAQFIYTMGTEQVKADVTWGVSGGANGSPVVVAYSYSPDNGTTWAAIKTKTINYDTSGNVTGTIWS